MAFAISAVVLIIFTFLPSAYSLARIDAGSSGEPKHGLRAAALLQKKMQTHSTVEHMIGEDDDVDRRGAMKKAPWTMPWSQPRLKKDFPFYHTTDELRDSLRQLQSSCVGAELRFDTRWDSHVGIDYVTVKGVNSSAHSKVFLLSGEHARELIGPETTLQFIRALCGADGGAVERNSTVGVAAVLRDSEFMLVVNGNPRSRKRVEKNDYCLRANPNGVDLNRNWDEEWNGSMTLTTDRGSEPFSEPETRIVKKLVEDYQPHTFVSVHSGTLGMYMPWAWSQDELANRNQESMMSVLRTLDAKHCKCPFGAAGKEVGYPCPGTSVDYVYDKLKAQYSFAFEIWGDPSEIDGLRRRWKDKMEQGGAQILSRRKHLGHPHFREVFHPKGADGRVSQHRSDFLHTSASTTSSATDHTDQMTAEECFTTFNPETREAFVENINNWAALFLELSDMTAANLKR